MHTDISQCCFLLLIKRYEARRLGKYYFNITPRVRSLLRVETSLEWGFLGATMTKNDVFLAMELSNEEDVFWSKKDQDDKQGLK